MTFDGSSKKMIKALTLLARAGRATQTKLFPELPSYSRGLPMITGTNCKEGCRNCVDNCPADAIDIHYPMNGMQSVTLDRGKCIACGECAVQCPSGTIADDRRTDIAVLARQDLIIGNSTEKTTIARKRQPADLPFQRSLHVRVVSTGDSAADLEIVAADNPIFDVGRFGIHIVASPRFADALVITGPVAHGMREPLLRCYEAMASPRRVIAVGTAAISGGLYRGGYASANGVDAVLPVDAYVPGNPPHPWSIIHGLLLTMGHIALKKKASLI
jgi:Ni,Fe-hydrogenase III small subunit/NAD-dependent dihydropyrimidine dehydrogenase PreA subunit